jgi:glucosamine-6-phosphate deaminase
VSAVPSTVDVVEGYDELSVWAAGEIVGVLSALERARIVVATGETPVGAYGLLARRYADGELDTSGLVVHQLDEYEGVGPDDPHSLGGWMRRSFLIPLGIPRDRTVWLPSASDPEALADYDRTTTEAGGFDLVILGIGINGHVGFNEPPSDDRSPTRLVTLSDESRRSSAGYRNDGRKVPERAVTIGLASLVRARTVVLLASGRSKADIVRRFLHGSVTPQVPASFLQRVQDLRVIVDRDAWPGEEGGR